GVIPVGVIPASPVILTAMRQGSSLAGLIENDRWAVIHAHSGTLALEWARDLRPDIIIIDPDLPDMPGVDVCRALHGDLRIGHNVPILLLARDKPSAEQRVMALRAGAWDFLCSPADPAELSLKLQTYLQAKRNIDVALAEGPADPLSGLHSRPVLARRARELGALMSRRHGALACVVFSLEVDPSEARVGHLLVRSVRLSDVVGLLSSTEFGIIAAGTDRSGAVKLARRVGGVLRASVDDGNVVVPGRTLKVGYDAVANLSYTPVDPAELLVRAAAAVRQGEPEADASWILRAVQPHKGEHGVAHRAVTVTTVSDGGGRTGT
ncbi:MAG TPA: response regulator, partial [Gemmatimonadales bacterium]|nr:response regulator [Gemmatimonadales bacterium]